MMKHPSVGPKLASHLGDVYKARWEEAKLGFVLTTIKQLEERKAADDALARGQLPELFAELRKLVTDLKIADLVEKNMDAELDTSNLKALMGWLWNSKRDLFSEGNMENDMTKGAAIVLRYLEAYRLVYDTRKEAEELLGHSPASDHGRRFLTGPGFLAGKSEPDKESATRWYQFVLKTRAHSQKQLLEIKGECMATPALDSAFDRDTLQALAWQQSWQGVWLTLYKQQTGAGGDSEAYTREHNANAAALLKGYREQILKQGCAAVSIMGPDKVKLGEAVVLKAEVKLPVVPKTPPVYRFQWSDVRSGMRFADATDTFKPKTTTAGDYQVKVEVFRASNGAWERIGEAAHKLAVELAQVSIKGPVSAVPGEKVSFEAVTSLAAAQSTLRYAWRYVGSANILGSAQSLSWTVATTGKYNLNVIVYQEVDRKSVKLGEATHTLVVELPSISVYIDGPNRSTVGQTLTYRAKVSAAAKGSPQYTYTWSLNGARLAGNASAGIPGARLPGEAHRPGRGLPGRRRQVAEGGRGELLPRRAGALCNLHHQHGEGPDQGRRVDDPQRDHLGDQPHGDLPALLCLADRRSGRRHGEQHLARGEQAGHPYGHTRSLDEPEAPAHPAGGDLEGRLRRGKAGGQEGRRGEAAGSGNREKDGHAQARAKLGAVERQGAAGGARLPVQVQQLGHVERRRLLRPEALGRLTALRKDVQRPVHQPGLRLLAPRP